MKNSDGLNLCDQWDCAKPEQARIINQAFDQNNMEKRPIPHSGIGLFSLQSAVSGVL